MHEVAFVIPTRNKAAWVGTAIKCALKQTYSPLTVVISDQGSTDGTKAVIDQYLCDYDGPHEIVRFDCPEQSETGIAGLNQHFNWLFPRIDAKLMVLNSADDWSHPERTSKVVDEWKRTGAACIANRIHFRDPVTATVNLSEVEMTAWPPELDNRAITPREHIEHKVGSSCFLAYERRLFDRFGPFEGATVNDITVPLWGAIATGLQFIGQPLGAYLKHADLNNAGLGGRLAAVAGDPFRLRQINEAAHYQIMSTYVDCLRTVSIEIRRLQDQGDEVPMHYEDALSALQQAAFDQAIAWTACRNDLTAHRVPPIHLN